MTVLVLLRHQLRQGATHKPRWHMLPNPSLEPRPHSEWTACLRQLGLFHLPDETAPLPFPAAHSAASQWMQVLQLAGCTGLVAWPYFLQPLFTQGWIQVSKANSWGKAMRVCAHST